MGKPGLFVQGPEPCSRNVWTNLIEVTLAKAQKLISNQQVVCVL